ncbi:MAG TPA: prolyl oligopeptidase family serine peptidase, partial [Burkholderiales bacterium]|nr:prolyl oligopeptidase family serine peptidase [Burkholderiales bacterium]
GVANIWIAPAGSLEGKVVTAERHRAIGRYTWAGDSRHVLYLQDSDGDENDHVFLADLEGTNVRDLTPFRGVKATNLLTSAKRPNEILVALNLRDRRLFDMHRIRLDSGALTLEAENPGDVLSWTTDARFVIRGATTFDIKSGRTSVRVRDGAAAPWRELVSWPFERTPIYYGQAWGATMILNFAPDGKTIDVLSSAGSDTLRAIRLDLATGKELAVLAADEKSDPVSEEGSLITPAVLVSPTSGKLQAIAYGYLTREWRFVDPALQADFTHIAASAPGFVQLVSRDAADRRWIVSSGRSDAPATYYLYEREAKKLSKLYSSQPALERYSLAPKKPVVIRARDGVELVSYLTLPPGVEPRNLPLVLNPHGGPFVRDIDNYEDTVQHLANRGYAVLQVNYRGSEGFGRKFVNLFTRQWGLATRDDLTDAVRWAIAQGIADPKRIAAAGGSAGGYATLRAITETPELYACAVALAAPADLKVMISSFPPYWGPQRERFLRRVGDVISDEAFNRKISPFYHLERIRVPLLLAYGANDVRVPLAQAESIVSALRRAGREVTYLVYPDEGHGNGRAENIIDLAGRIEEFLAKCLGGRYEPWAKVPGSTADVR